MSGRSTGWHAIVTLTGQWGRYGVQIVALVLFSRLLEPQEVGVVAMVTAVIGIAYVVGDLGLSLAAIQAPTLSEGQRTNLFWLTALIGLALGVLIALGGPALAAYYGDDRVQAVAIVLSSVFVANGFAGQFRTELIRARRFEPVAVADVAGQLVGLAVGAAVILAGGGLWGMVAQQVVAALATAAWVVIASGWWPGLPSRAAPMSDLLRFGSFTLAASIVQYISVNVDQILIGRTWGTATVGVYNRAVQVARVPAQQIGAPLTRVVVPRLVAVRDDAAALQARLNRLQTVLGSALVLLLAYLVALAPELIRIGLGPGWSGAVDFVRVLCLAAILEALSRVFYWAFVTHGVVKAVFYVELVVRGLTVVAMALVVGHGAIWVAWVGVGGQLGLLLANAVVLAPRVGVAAGPLLARGLLAVAVVAPATTVTVLVGGAVSPPTVVAWLLLSALWVACLLPALAVTPVRRTVGAAATSVRRRVGARGTS